MKSTTCVIIMAMISTCVLGRSLRTIDDKVMEITCLGKFTWVFHHFMFIDANNNGSTDTYYCVRTPWFITYDNRIKNGFEKEGVIVLDSNPVSKCGWTMLAHVKMAGASTGSVYRKNQTNKTVEEIALRVLSSKYPSLEIALVVIGASIAFVLLCVCMYVSHDY